VSLEAHVKILGYIYTALACLMGLLILIVLMQGTAQAAKAGTAFLILGAWWLRTGYGLLRRRPSARLRAIIVAAVLMLGLNGIFLLAGGEPFSSSAGWITFHAASMAVGVYTLAVMLRPSVSDLLRGGS
jgi:hypothetical protein